MLRRWDGFPAHQRFAVPAKGAFWVGRAGSDAAWPRVVLTGRLGTQCYYKGVSMAVEGFPKQGAEHLLHVGCGWQLLEGFYS